VGCTGAGLDGVSGDVIRVEGREFQWRFRFPGDDRRFDTADDRIAVRELHLPAGVPIELRFVSRDYVYTFALPELDLEQIAVPEMLFVANLPAASVGRFKQVGDRMCGYDHEGLNGEVVIEPRERFERWLESLPSQAIGG
jgi:cytochrome c oxidase subunit 2